MIRRGTRGSQPAASGVGVGTLYFVTDEGVIERSSGSAWESYSSGLVLVESQTASASSALNFTSFYSTLFDEYVIEIVNLIPASAAVELYLRMSTDGGSSYDSGNNYAWTDYRIGPGGAAAGGTTSTAQIIITGGGTVETLPTTATKGYCATFRLFSPGSSVMHKRIVGSAVFFSSGSILVTSQIAGEYRVATAVNAFRILMSSGNIASGSVRVYGVVNS